MQAPLWVFDVEARGMVWANPAGLELWGAANLDELRARDFSDMSDAAVTRFRAALARMAAGEVLHEQWTLYPKGKPTTVSVTRVAIELEDGSLASLQEAQPAALVDPETLRAVEALHHTQLRIALFRRDGAIVLENPAASSTFGLLEGGPERDSFAALFDDAEDAARARVILAEGAVYSAEVPLATVGGARWHGIDARTVLDPVTGAPLTLVNARDIEDRRSAEAALLRSVESQKRFLAAISHEIRTPLNSVVGFVELLRGTQLNERQRRFAGNAHLSAQHLLALVTDVLDVSKVQAEQLELARDELDLEDVLVESVVIASTRVRPGVDLSYSLPELDSAVIGDRVRLTQIFVNLLGNAAKFTETGFVRLRLVERESAGPEGAVSLEVTIEDSGIGIPEAKLPDLFTAFGQAHGSKLGGTGLGLFLSRSLARLMGGDIRVESAVGSGSRFTVALTLPRGASRTEGRGLAGQRVLLLTRDEGLALVLSEGFHGWGAEIVTSPAPTTSDALRLCLDTGARCDVIVLDFELSPSARAIAALLREHCPKAKLVGLLARPEGDSLPVDVVMTKPFSFYRLTKLLEAASAGLAEVPEAGDLRGMRVLVAEDVDMNIDLLREMFQSWYGLGFDVARDGEEAVAKVRANGYDLVLMDLQMPRVDGVEATRRIREAGLRVPIVALTASAMSDDMERARAAGVDGYMTKPVRRLELTRALQRYAPAQDEGSRLSRPPRVARPSSVVPVHVRAPSLGLLRDAASPVADLVAIARAHFESIFDSTRAQRLVASSSQGVRSGLERLDEVRAAGDLEELGRALHALKGLLLNSGLLAHGERASELEQLARAGRAPEPTVLDQLAAELRPYSRAEAP